MNSNKYLKKIETHKNSGLPKLTSALFKTLAKILLNQCRYLFNLCLCTCTFPISWKTVTVTPLFKAGSPNDPGNYRPIACIPLPGKILEKCILEFIIFWNILNYLVNINSNSVSIAVLTMPSLNF